MPATDPAAARARSALAAATARLQSAGVPSPAVDARALVSHAARATGPLVMLEELPVDFGEVLEQALDRRERREPLQLILGRAPFRQLEIAVAPGVFIPRPETEIAVDLVLDSFTSPLRPERSITDPRVADLCTGSGAIAAALLDEHPSLHVIAVELDRTAAALARGNLSRVDAERGRVLRVDVTSPELVDLLGGEDALDAVVSNPPYIPADAVPEDPEVHAHDPHRALFGGGADGLDVPRAVLEAAGRLLRPGGVLVMEHADVQGAELRRLARAHGGFDQIATVPDLTGRDRFLRARAAGGPGTRAVRD